MEVPSLVKPSRGSRSAESLCTNWVACLRRLFCCRIALFLSSTSHSCRSRSGVPLLCFSSRSPCPSGRGQLFLVLMVKIQTERVLLDMLACPLNSSLGVCPPKADSVSELLSLFLPRRSPSLPFSAFLPALSYNSLISGVSLCLFLPLSSSLPRCPPASHFFLSLSSPALTAALPAPVSGSLS